VGPDGTGCSWVTELDEDEEDEENPINKELIATMNQIGFTSNDFRQCLKQATQHQIWELEENVSNTVSSDEEEEDKVEEIKLTIQRALEQNHPLENALLELNTLKFALNLTFQEVRHEVIPTILNYVFYMKGSQYKEHLTKWVGVWRGLTHQVEDQIDLLKNVTEWFEQHEDRCKFAGTLCMILYNEDIVEEEGFLQWFEEQEFDANSSLKQGIQPFIQWLEEAEEEDDDAE
jgi:translation initiation factor eIF-2B subunit epsilon